MITTELPAGDTLTYVDYILLFAETVGGFGPVLALMGAIFLFYAKATDDRRQAAKSGRMSAYVRFLEANQTVIAMSSMKQGDLTVLDVAGRTLPLLSEIQLLGSDEIHKSCCEYSEAMLEHAKQLNNRRDNEGRNEELDRTSKVLKSKSKTMIAQMKSDLNSSRK